MADPAVRDAILNLKQAHQALAPVREAQRLEVLIDQQRARVERAENTLDREVTILRGLEALRKPEGKTNGKA